MKKLLISATSIGLVTLMIAAQTTGEDPVVMTIDNQDVRLSEFEYLYKKNNSQQLQPVTFDEYVDMFVDYKLKVADARHEQLDTTSQFKKEFDKFRRDLAMPYLRDTVMEENLVEEAYSHTKNDRYVSHIMVDPRVPGAEQKLDSIRNLILNGELSFEDAAIQNSVDSYSAQRGGKMSWLGGTGMYPWAFEKAAYDTPVGEVSEVINSGVGLHIVRPEQERPAMGEVKVRHILLLTRNTDDSVKTQKKARIDSLYAVVNSGADFSDLAARYSEDTGSAKNGGLIDWFGPGRMVAEFDSVAFSLPEGGVSEPIETTFGYHIVKNEGHRHPSLELMRPKIKSQMKQDGRDNMPVNAMIETTAKAIGATIVDDYKKAVSDILDASDGICDSLAIAGIRELATPVFIVNDDTYTVADVTKTTTLRDGMPADMARNAVDRAVKRAFDEAIINVEIDQLYDNNAEYRNLVNEYRDGIMLFDVSNNKVWDRASKDTAGQEAFFKKNKKKYATWTEPRFKSYVIFATSDSALNEIKQYLDTERPSTASQEAFTTALRDKFGKSVKVERVIAAKGDNPITDYLGFGGERPQSGTSQWKSYMAYDSKLIKQPEEVADVKGLVVTDYQSALEKEWLKELHKAYKVEINRDNLKLAE